MRTFLAGGSGAIGIRLIPLLVSAGHEVAATTRSPSKAERLAELRATPVVVDVLDADLLRTHVVNFQPELVIHQVTHLPDDIEQIPDFAVANNQVRQEGTANLVAAARAAGAEQLVAQSVAWSIPGNGGQAVHDLEHQVLQAGGVIVRYGQFYGPDTYYPGEPPPHPRIHIDEAARQTLLVLDHPGGVVTLTEG